MNRRYLMYAACAVACVLTGCSGKQNGPLQTETPVQIMTETVTEAVSEKVTEYVPVYEDIKDELSFYPVRGTLSYQFLFPERTGEVSFAMTGDAFSGIDSNGNQLYSAADKTLYMAQEWKETSLHFKGIPELLESNWTLMDNAEINGTMCYHISSKSETSSVLAALCLLEGYEKFSISAAKTDMYFAVESGSFIRMDIIMNFTADAENSLSASLVADEIDDSLIIMEPSMEQETEIDPYVPGQIDEEKNAYLHEDLDLQLAGGNLYTFDAAQTSAVQETYEEKGISYREEAYAQGDGIKVNVQSVSLRDGKTQDEAMAKYMSDTKAESLQSAGTFTVGNTTYICTEALVGSTKTKTYCSSTPGRAILITAYYQDENKKEAFEKRSIP